MSTKRYAAIALVIILVSLAIPSFALTSKEKEASYNAGILELETYLESFENNPSTLMEIQSIFAELQGYEQSKFLGYYVSCLLKIEEEEYDYELSTFLDVLKSNVGFKKYLEALNSSAIGSIEELVAYATAREYEYQGDTQNAVEYYMQCSNYYDASERYISLQQENDRITYEYARTLLKNGDLAGAYFYFSEASKYSDSEVFMSSIINQLGYTPASANDNLKPVSNLRVETAGITQIVLAWNKSEHATSYEVFYKGHARNDWTFLGETTETKKTIMDLESGASYDFKVVAILGRIKSDETILLSQKTSVVTPTPKPVTPVPSTPTPKPVTPTPKPVTPTPKPVTPTPEPFSIWTDRQPTYIRTSPSAEDQSNIKIVDDANRKYTAYGTVSGDKNPWYVVFIDGQKCYISTQNAKPYKPFTEWSSTKWYDEKQSIKDAALMRENGKRTVYLYYRKDTGATKWFDKKADSLVDKGVTWYLKGNGSPKTQYGYIIRERIQK